MQSSLTSAAPCFCTASPTLNIVQQRGTGTGTHRHHLKTIYKKVHWGSHSHSSMHPSGLDVHLGAGQVVWVAMSRACAPI